MNILKSPYPDGGAPFSPSDLSGLIVWLKADALALSDGDPVSIWTDSSGGGHNATQSTTAAKPIFKTGGPGGKPFVRFDGTQQFMTLGDLSALFPSAATWCCVATINNTGGTSLMIYSHQDNDAYTRLGNSGGAGYWGLFRSMRYEGWPTVGPTNGSHRLILTSDSGGTGIWFDGTSQGTSPANGSSHTPGNNHTIGNEPGHSRFLAGDIPEIALYNRVLNSTERGQMDTYFTAKYGV